MGIFYEHVKVVNRAPVKLTVRYDGQEIDLPPGEGSIPQRVIRHALNQNPVMGSQDPNNPHMSGARYLIGIVDPEVAGRYDLAANDCTPLTEVEWEAHLGRPCRVDVEAMFEEKYANDPKAKLVKAGKGRVPAAKSRFEAGGISGSAGLGREANA